MVSGGVFSIVRLTDTGPGMWLSGLLFSIIGLILTIIFLTGLFTLEPNEASVLVLFGNYKGSVKETGFWWVNPLITKKKISLRARNFDSDRLKVNVKSRNGAY